MRSKLTVILVAAFVVSALTPLGPARADSIVYIGEPQIPLQPTDWAEFITVPKFDTNIGQLTFVVVRLSASFETRLLVENLSPSAGEVSAALTATVVVAPPAPLYPMSAEVSIGGTQMVAPHIGQPGIPDWLPGPDLAAWSLETTVTASQTYISVDPFIGSGQPSEVVSFNVSAAAEFWVSGDMGNLAMLPTSSAGAALEVEYFYIPEPTALSFILLGFCVARRRRANGCRR